MTLLKKRQIILLAIVLVLLVSACGLKVDSPFADPAEPVATVDTGAITKAVLAEIEGQLAVQSAEQAAQLEAQVAEQVRAQTGELDQATASEY